MSFSCNKVSYTLELVPVTHYYCWFPNISRFQNHKVPPRIIVVPDKITIMPFLQKRMGICNIEYVLSVRNVYLLNALSFLTILDSTLS